MASVRSCVFIRVIILLFVTSLSRAEAKIDAKVAQHFKVNWSSIRYDKSLNIQRTSPKNLETSERLSLSCEIEILDPDLILGTTQEGVLTQRTDSNGRNVYTARTGQLQHDLMRMSYEGLRYRRR